MMQMAAHLQLITVWRGGRLRRRNETAKLLDGREYFQSMPKGDAEFLQALRHAAARAYPVVGRGKEAASQPRCGMAGL